MQYELYEDNTSITVYDVNIEHKQKISMFNLNDAYPGKYVSTDDWYLLIVDKFLLPADQGWHSNKIHSHTQT